MNGTRYQYTLWLLIPVFSCQQKQTDASNNRPDSLVSTASMIQSTLALPNRLPGHFFIIPGRQVGHIDAAATEAGLLALLGANNVQHDTIYVIDGTYAIGTTLYKNTPDQAQILWADTLHFARPRTVLLRPSLDQDNNPLPGPHGTTPRWVTDQGVRIGMTLREVEKINGRPFSLYGFEWDYSGLSLGWKGGSLAQKDGTTYLGASFAPANGLSQAQATAYQSLLGDQELLSANPAMRQLNPTIQTLSVSFK